MPNFGFSSFLVIIVISFTINVLGLQAGVYIIHFLKDEVSIALGRFVKME